MAELPIEFRHAFLTLPEKYPRPPRNPRWLFRLTFLCVSEPLWVNVQSNFPNRERAPRSTIALVTKVQVKAPPMYLRNLRSFPAFRHPHCCPVKSRTESVGWRFR